MKKIIALVLTLALVLACGCAAKTDDTVEEGENETAQDGTQNPGENGEAGPTEGGDDEAGAAEIETNISEGLTEDGYIEGIRASDYVKLPDYKNITLPADCIEPDEDEVAYQINNAVLVNYGEPDYEKAVEDGDTVNIDYVGSVDGVEFSGGSTGGAGTEVTIGVTDYIPGFLPQLIGHKAGENFDISVKFPDDYWNAELAGADAVFNITVNYVVSVPTELTDEMAQDFGFDTAEALIADVEDWVLQNSRNNFYDSLVAEAEFTEIPAAARAFYENYIIKDYELSYGYDLSEEREEFLEYYEAQYGSIDDLVKESLFALAIAEKEGVAVTDAEIAELGMEYYAEIYGAPFIKNQIMVYKIVPGLVLNPEVSE